MTPQDLHVGFKVLDTCLDLLYCRWHQYHALAALGPINAEIPLLAGTEWEAVFDTPWRARGAPPLH